MLARTRMSLGDLNNTSASPFDLDFTNIERQWPRYMTLWLQNYRYVKPGDAANKVWGQNNGGCTDDDGFNDTPIQNIEN